MLPTTRRRVPFTVELKNTPFKQQEQALYFICDRLPRRDGIWLDARGNGQYLAEQAAYRYGQEVVQVMLSVGFIARTCRASNQRLKMTN
ncbi:hypothetical protein H2136_22855 [Aeromonas hydrophila]|uniref:Uncharacterized protein n=1 Tax=Aeromonas hydrophila TaxID=644 RepID=A0A926FP85_AERHY|nr:hypothetical protein [Aeromonas hydrophila]